jgi:hypothetical protein
VSRDCPKRGRYFVVLKANQPLTLEAVARSFTDPWTPRRPLEVSTEVASYLAQPEALDPEDGEAGTIAGWSALAQVCRIHREVEYSSGV